MNLAPEIVGALIGAATVSIGLVIAEILRRQQRAEMYASTVFAKRLEVYEGLWKRVSDGQSLANEVLNGDHTDEERHGLISVAVLGLAEYADDNAFYLDEELTVHCTTLFMGVENAAVLSELDRAKWDAGYSKRLRQTKRMILEAAGVTRISRVFRAVNKPRIDSAVIRYFRQEAKKQLKD